MSNNKKPHILHPGDKPVHIKVDSQSGRVALLFSAHINQISMTPELARTVAQGLLDHASRAQFKGVVSKPDKVQ